VKRWLMAAPLHGWGLVQAQIDLPAPQVCALCGVDLRLGFDFAVGAALLVGLIWVLHWIESASLPAITEHLFGATIAGFVLFLFMRFFAGGA
jgi:hypothetical protein